MILKGKTVIVTGVGPGMGRKMAVGAAAEGANVAMAARSADFLAEVEKEITDAGGKCIAVITDVSKMEDCENIAAKTIAAFGRIDGLVNSAYYHPDWLTFEDAHLDQWAKAYDVACMGAMRMIRACLPQMKAQGGASVVNITTLAQRKPMIGEGGYAIAKAGLGQVTRQLAVELGGYGIRVNQAAMGWLWGVPLQGYVSMMEQAGRNRDELIGEITGRIALKRLLPDQDCAKAIYFLLSDYASEVTGAALDVNGGEWVTP